MKPLLIHNSELLNWSATNDKIQAFDLSLNKKLAEDINCGGEQGSFYEYQGVRLQPYLSMVDSVRGIAKISLSGAVFQLTESQASWYYPYVICNREATRAVESAISHPGINGVVVTVDSPGGTCVGTPELARALNRLSLTKPTICAIDNMSASAGYWIASGCGTIYATPSSSVGSVGVYSIHMDHSKTYEAMYSTKMTLVRNGEQKADMLREMTPEMQALWQSSVDNIATQFRDTVKGFRGVSIDDKFLQGQCLSGDEALSAGLIDAVCDNPQEQAISDILGML